MSKSPLRILIADDQQASIDAIKCHLRILAESSPWQLEIAETYSAAGVLQHLEEFPVDVVFLDQQFPGGTSGGEIIDDLLDPLSSRFVVLFSQHGLEELRGTIAANVRKWGERFMFISKEINRTDVFHVLEKINKYFMERPYPFPLAYARKTIDSLSHAQGKFDAWKNLGECIAQYSVGVLMAELRELGLGSEVSIRLGWKSTMTFGAWLSWLRGLLRLVKPHSSRLVVKQLLAALDGAEFQVRGLQSVTGQCLLHELKNDRDLIAGGHAHARLDEFYQGLVTKYSDPLDRMYRQLRFLTNYPLLRVESIDLEGGDQFTYWVRLLMGSDPTFAVTTLTLPVRLPRESVFIFSIADGRVLWLHPFVLYRICQSCRTPHVFLLDSANDNSLRYNAACDNRISAPECMKDLQQLFPNLMRGPGN